MSQRLSRIVPLSLAVFLTVLVLCVAGVCRAEAAPNGKELKAEVEKLFELGSSPEQREQAQSQYEQLQVVAPEDARIPYAYAVVLVSQHRDCEAARLVDEAFHLGCRDLTLWRMKIWLAVQQGRYDEALGDIVALCARIPEEPSSAEVEATCRDTARYAGQVCAFMVGPGRGRGKAVTEREIEYRLHPLLSEPNRICYEQGRQSVRDLFSDYSGEIDNVTAAAIEAEQSRRERRLTHQDEDSSYAWTELDKMEDIRGHVREGATSERNTLAATRSQEIGTHDGAYRARAANRYDADYRYRAGSRFGGRYDRNRNGIGLFDPGAGGPPVPFGYNDQTRARFGGRSFERADGSEEAQGAARADGGETGRYYAETGYGDWAWGDVNRREENEFHRLDQRETNMYRRQRRIATDEGKLLGKPVIGNTGQLRSLKSKATALATYVPLPLSPDFEQARILRWFESPRLSSRARPASLLAAR